MRETGLESTEQVQVQVWTGDEADSQAMSLLRASASSDMLESWVALLARENHHLSHSLGDSANRHPVLLQNYVSAEL